VIRDQTPSPRAFRSKISLQIEHINRIDAAKGFVEHNDVGPMHRQAGRLRPRRRSPPILACPRFLRPLVQAELDLSKFPAGSRRSCPGYSLRLYHRHDVYSTVYCEIDGSCGQIADVEGLRAPQVQGARSVILRVEVSWEMTTRRCRVGVSPDQHNKRWWSCRRRSAASSRRPLPDLTRNETPLPLLRPRNIYHLVGARGFIFSLSYCFFCVTFTLRFG